MDENVKNRNNIILRVFFVLFIVFICLYSIEKNGFVEKMYEDKTLYTEEQIKRYENDIHEEKNIDEIDYKLNEKKDYSNIVSNIGEYLSELINTCSRKSIELLKNFFSYLFE